jgi:hypothetical protein
MFSWMLNGSNINTNITTYSSNSSRGLQIIGSGKYVINGKEYDSDQVTVRTEYKINSTGEAVYTEPSDMNITVQETKHLQVMVSSGDVQLTLLKPCQQVDVKSSSGNVTVHGDVYSATTSSGDIQGRKIERAISVSGSIHI